MDHFLDSPPEPLLVFIAFVTGDVDQDFDAGGFAGGLKHVDRAADVRGEGPFSVRRGRRTGAGRVEGIADDLRPQFLQPDGQPGTLEGSMADN